MEKWLIKTAWPMTPPLPYSLFHLAFAAIGITAAALLAWRLRRLSHSRRVILLFALGLVLAVAEGYKQLFLYYIIDARCYDWWYFPFQLCSVPMYLCLCLPWLSQKGQGTLCTFMYSYNLLGAFMVFVEPSGLMHPYWTLTLHSFLWHIILIFIGLLIAFSGMCPRSGHSFAKATGLFLLCCLIATGINILASPYGNPDMFYITPYYPTTQLIYARIAKTLGTIPGNIIYLLSIILGAWLLYLGYEKGGRCGDSQGAERREGM